MRRSCCVFNILVELVWLHCRVSARPYVAYNGYAYATLDGASPTESGNEGCQTSYLVLPEGWQIAPDDTTVAQNVIADYSWGTNLLVVANGAAYFTTNANHYGNVQPGQQYVSSGRLKQSGDAYRVTYCSYRVLIYQELTTTVTPTSTGTSTSITSTSITSTTITSTTITSTSITETKTTTTQSTSVTETATSTTRTENPERSVSQSLIFMNVGLWTGGILIMYLVLLSAPVALFEYFRTPGLDRE